MEGSGLTCISVPAADCPVHEEREREREEGREMGKTDKELAVLPAFRRYDEDK